MATFLAELAVDALTTVVLTVDAFFVAWAGCFAAVVFFIAVLMITGASVNTLNEDFVGVVVHSH